MDKDTLTLCLAAANLVVLLGGGYKAFIVLQLGVQQVRTDLDEHTSREEVQNQRLTDRLDEHGNRLTRLETAQRGAK